MQPQMQPMQQQMQQQPPTVIVQQQYPAPVYQPPQYGQPQPYYVQQGAQPGQPIYIQQPQQQPAGPRIIKDWDDSQPIPPGYHQESHIRKGLVIGGAVLFGSTYLLSALSAALITDASNATGSSSSAGALFIPVVGPFVEIGQVHGDATASLFLVLDGLCQAGGVTMFAIGLASPRTELVRNDFGFNMHFAPIVSKDYSGMGLVGKF